MTESNVLLLNAEGLVINSIVVNADTPSDFLTTLKASTDEPFKDVSETVLITDSKSNIGIGWKRGADKKFVAPPTPVLPENPTEIIVSEVLSDDRLSDLTPAQSAILEDVLNERVGRRPTP